MTEPIECNATCEYFEINRAFNGRCTGIKPEPYRHNGKIKYMKSRKTYKDSSIPFWCPRLKCNAIDG